MQIRTQPYLETLPGLAQHFLLVRRLKLKQLQFNWHYHPEIEIIYFPRGRGVRYVGRSIERFEGGDLCVLGKNVPHTWLGSPQPGLEVLVIQFLPKFFEGGLQGAQELAGIRQLLERSTEGLCVEGGHREWKPVVDLMQRIEKLPPESWRRPALLLELLGILSEVSLRALNHELSAALSDTTGGPALRTVLNHVHENFAQKIHHEQVAQLVRMSPSTFCRFFKRHMGQNFSNYVNDVRQMRACNALIDPEKRIIEIAYECGYNNLAYFNRRFKALWGRSPRDYRRSYRQKNPLRISRSNERFGSNTP